METIIIVANLGRLKAYRIENTPTRGRKAALVDDMEMIDAHMSLSDHFTDQSGRFQKTVVGRNRKMSHLSAYEATTLELEIHRRLMRLVTEKVKSVLMQEKPEMWFFAAAPEIHDQVLGGLPAELRERMTRGVKMDIVNEAPAEVLERFEW